MNIELFKISSVDLPHHPAYVAGNLGQMEKVCELIGTKNTVWSQEEIDRLGAKAAAGEFNMHTSGSCVTLSLPTAELNKAACLTCVHRQPGTKECRRMPPQVWARTETVRRNVGGLAGISASSKVTSTRADFPVVEDACWCGEYKSNTQP